MTRLSRTRILLILLANLPAALWYDWKMRH